MEASHVSHFKKTLLFQAFDAPIVGFLFSRQLPVSVLFLLGVLTVLAMLVFFSASSRGSKLFCLGQAGRSLYLLRHIQHR